jgi:hypothetical protein
MNELQMEAEKKRGAKSNEAVFTAVVETRQWSCLLRFQ